MNAAESAEWDEDKALRWESLDAGGWEPLLPHAGRDRWLCLDTTGGAQSLLLAGVCAQLDCVGARAGDAAAIRARLDRFGVRNAIVHEALPASLAGAPFDGFILHDVGGVLDRDAVGEALGRARALVAPHGFLYAALRNRYGYMRARGGAAEYAPAAAARYFRPADLAAHASGRSVTIHPLLCTAEGQLFEVIPPSGYLSGRNATLRRERVREWVLGPRGARIFAPAFAWVARGPGGPPSVLEATMRALAADGLVTPNAELKRYLALRGGKVIASAGESERRHGCCIVVYARAAVAIERRAREFGLLRALRERLPPALAARVPRAHAHDEVAGAHRFVIEEFPGMTIEAPVPQLAAATRSAAAFILALHRATARRERLTAARIDALVGPFFETAHARYPMLRAPLERLRAAVGASLEGRELPLVWMHGDFKIENAVVDREGGLVGVIDWELAEPEALPFLDPGFLVLYNVTIRRGEPFVPAVRSLYPPMALPGEERGLLDEYVRALDIPPAAVPALVGVLFVHHVARRLFYDGRDAKLMARLAALIDELLRWVAAEGTKRDS